MEKIVVCAKEGGHSIEFIARHLERMGLRVYEVTQKGAATANNEE